MIDVKLINKNNKKHLIEQVNLYIKFVNLNSELKLGSYKIDELVVSELIKLGLISDSEQSNEVRQVLGEELFDEFIFAINTKIIEKIDDPFINRLYKRTHKIKKGKYHLIDLFCGAGGLSLGFKESGVDIVLANDINSTCIETYKFNHPELIETQAITNDLREIVDDINNFVDPLLEIDFLVGGPPCQGFSSANKRRIIDDPRNELYKYFIKAVDKLTPKFVVMENVKGMLKVADQVVEDFSNIKSKKNGKIYTYKTSYAVLTSNRFSVAQKRERLIYIAIRNDIVEHKRITPQKIIDNLVNIEYKEFSLNDAIYDLPELEAEFLRNQNEIDSLKSGSKIAINNTEMTEYKSLINNQKNSKYIFNHKARFLNENNYQIYSRMNQGDDGTAEQIQDIYKYSHRNHSFKDRYFRLFADKPSRTITAHLKMDGHSHIHPFQNRSLTPREAARIQSFPDEYLFLGSYLDTFMQIGNAVPPLLSQAIARELIKYVEE